MNTARIAGLPNCNADKKTANHLRMELALIIVFIPVVAMLSIFGLSTMFSMMVAAKTWGFIGFVLVFLGLLASMLGGVFTVVLMNSVGPRFRTIRNKIVSRSTVSL